jgi:uncharacterized coiled-coil protein SlyX
VTTEDYQERWDLARRLGHLEGQLAETREHVAALDAELAERQIELDQARSAAAAAEEQLTHFQRRGREREEEAERRLADLGARLAESERLRRAAEDERRAVISALGRRARRTLTKDERPNGR